MRFWHGALPPKPVFESELTVLRKWPRFSVERVDASGGVAFAPATMRAASSESLRSARSRGARGLQNHHVLTIAVEDYFHVAALRGAVRDTHWSRLEPRLERNLDATLELLGRHSARATFFVFGRIAETQPELVRRIAEAGHEVASRGYWPRATAGMSEAEFLEDLHRARRALEAAGANRILGYRSPTWIGQRELWKLDVLAEEGYLYDASINPKLWSFAGHPECDGVYEHRHRALRLWEFPVTTVGPRFLRLPISGGNYIRQIPHTLLRHLVARADRRTTTPLVFYFMPWELDTDQPQIQGISALQRLRHYRNLGKARWVMEDYLGRHRFVGVADHLEVCHPPLEPEVKASGDSSGRGFVTSGEPVTLVVPIYNEEKNVAYLRRTLREFRLRLVRSLPRAPAARGRLLDGRHARGARAGVRQGLGLPHRAPRREPRGGGGDHDRHPGSAAPRSSARSTATAPTIPASSRRCSRSSTRPTW